VDRLAFIWDLEDARKETTGTFVSKATASRGKKSKTCWRQITKPATTSRSSGQPETFAGLLAASILRSFSSVYPTTR